MKINERSFSSKKATETSLAAKALDAIDDPLVVLDDQGLITFANASWHAEAKNNRLADGALPKHTRIGSNYLAVCQRAKGYCSELSTDAFNGISDVLSGKRRAYELIYPCHSPNEQRWFLMTVEPLRGINGCSCSPCSRLESFLSMTV